MPETRSFEWPTLAMLAGTYAVWIFGTMLWVHSGVFGAILAIALTGLAITQHSSLQHEVLHGHPFKSQWLNEALVFPPLMLFIPYLRFKDTHLQHHFDPALTDPYDDPESNFQDPAVWERLSRPMQKLLRMNNTLLGRMLIGPILGCYMFVRGDVKLMQAGNRRVMLAWVFNLVGVAMILAWLHRVGMPVLAYALAVYIGAGVLKIRTYLEHRAHDLARARSVIIESRGPLSYLFLNNSFHAVHHTHPELAWYRLPVLYAERPEYYKLRNEAYVYRSYIEIFRQHLLKAKDPVPHPVWPVNKGSNRE